MASIKSLLGENLHSLVDALAVRLQRMDRGRNLDRLSIFLFGRSGMGFVRWQWKQRRLALHSAKRSVLYNWVENSGQIFI